MHAHPLTERKAYHRSCRPPPPQRPLNLQGRIGVVCGERWGTRACHVCLGALWSGYRSRSCSVLAAPCTYGDREPNRLACLQGRSMN